MTYFDRQYYALSTKYFGFLGFKRNKRTFIRVVNDVMQNFTLVILRSGKACRVEFAILPLCMKIDNETAAGGVLSYNLRRMEEGSGPWDWDSWVFDPHSSQEVDVCIRDIARYFQTYLLPIFLQVNTCEKAVSAYSALENLCFMNWWNARGRPGEHQWRMNNLGVDKSSVFYAALKSKDYELALRSREALLQQNEVACKSNWDNLSEQAKVQRLQKLDILRNDIKRLQEKDFVFFQTQLKENEEETRKLLKKYIVE